MSHQTPGRLPIQCHSPDGRLLARPSGKQTLIKQLRPYLHDVSAAVGISTRIVPHQLGHTYASEMVRAGISLPALMKLLGHGDPEMTMRYVDVTGNDLQLVSSGPLSAPASGAATQGSRLARSFDHKRMKDAGTAILKEMGNIPIQPTAGADAEQAARFRLSTVAQAFVDLQQARHKADYDVGEPFVPVDAAVDVAQARLGQMAERVITALAKVEINHPDAEKAAALIRQRSEKAQDRFRT